MLRLKIFNFTFGILNKLISNFDKNRSIKDHLDFKEKLIFFFNKHSEKLSIKNSIFLDQRHIIDSYLIEVNHINLSVKNIPDDLLLLEIGLVLKDSLKVIPFDLEDKSIEEKNQSTCLQYKSSYYRTWFIQNEIDMKIIRDELNGHIPQSDWTILKEFSVGMSYLLNCSLNLYQTSASNQDRIYLENCSERILRKLEIGRSNVIDFKDKSINKKAHISEHMKIIHFCLKLCEENKDIRFLNAAMKAMDRIFYLVNKIELNQKLSLIDIEILILYIMNIQRQERLFKELICDE